MVEILQDIQIKRSSTTSAPPSLRFGELAFTDVSGIKKFFIGDASSNVYLIKISDLGTTEQQIDLNSHKIINLANGTDDTDAANWGQVQALVNGLKWRSPVVVAEPNNINVANPGTSTFDGVTLTQGDRLLLFGQINSGENGIYIFDSSSTPLTRPRGSETLVGIDTTAVMIDQGNHANSAYVLQVANTAGILGTEEIEVIPFANSTLDADLQSIATLNPSDNDMIYYNGGGYSTFSPLPGSVLTHNNSGALTSIQGNDGDLLVKSGGVWTHGNIINGGTF